MKYLKLLPYFSFFLLILSSCGDDDDGPEPLQAKIVVDDNYSTGATVTLDASTSEGISGASVEWRVNGLPSGLQESDIISLGFERNSVTTSFTVERVGNYIFLLQITKNGRISTTTASFNVSGVLEINSIDDLNEQGFRNLDGIDVESTGDYLINTVLTIPENETISIEPGTTLMFGPNGGLDIIGGLFGQSGTNYFVAQQEGFKGIRLEGSINNIGTVIINKGGNSSFTSDPNDAAALYIDNGAINCDQLSISSSLNYALVHSENTSSGGSPSGFEFNDNLKTARISTKYFFPRASRFFVTDKEEANIELYYEDYGTSGEPQTVFSLNLLFLDSLVIPENRNFSFVGTNMKFNPGAYLRVVPGSFLNASEAVFESIDPGSGALWAGIMGFNLFLDDCVIRNAGGAIIPGAVEQAGISMIGNNSSLSMTNCIIENNIGRGLYLEGSIPGFISDCQFINNSAGHVKMFWPSVDRFSPDNSFSPGVVAIEAFDPHGGNSFNGLTIQEELNPLGGDAYYLFRTDAAYEALVLNPNVHIKMGLNNYLDVRTDFVANGTASEPIIIEGESNNQGFWQGLRIQDDASMSFVEILDGGSNDGATTYSAPFSAGLTVQSAPSRNVSVTDCEISNSGGYGVVIKQGAGDFAIDSIASNNTLQGVLGAYFDDN